MTIRHPQKQRSTLPPKQCIANKSRFTGVDTKTRRCMQRACAISVITSMGAVSCAQSVLTLELDLSTLKACVRIATSINLPKIKNSKNLKSRRRVKVLALTTQSGRNEQPI